MTQNDGGPAFPRQHTVADANDIAFKPGHDGMSLRDYFAGRAMQGWLQCWDASGPRPEQTDLCKLSYWVADAMLKEREQSDDDVPGD